MKIEQRKWTQAGGWKEMGNKIDKADLVFVFGATQRLKQESVFAEVQAIHPEAHLLMCSTAGEILGAEVSDDSLAYTAVSFASTTLSFASADIVDAEDSERVGNELSARLPKKDLVHVMVFSDGLKVNGTALVKGLLEHLSQHQVSVTGGLVGDGSAFKETVLGLDALPESGKVVVIGFHGANLRVGYGSLGGWDPFGPTRLITKAKANVLYELDGKPALKLYKEYLGDKASELPSSGLLFPLSLTIQEEGRGSVEVVRTLLAVNEEDQSMTFAGDMPVGVQAKLMKANFDRLIDGAGGAASVSLAGKDVQPDLAILISCVGRKLVLKERVEEEIEAVRAVMGEQTAMTGFYSYGEICPTAATEKQCQLHNQTMTITTFKEV